MTAVTTVDESRLTALLHQVVGEWGALLSAALVVVGDRTGLFRAMSDGQPRTPEQVAAASGLTERYVREWLAAQAAGGFVDRDDDGRYRLNPEQAIVFAQDGHPACLVGGFEAFVAAAHGVDHVADAFRTGEGIAWGEHPPALFSGTARFFRNGYQANLISSWIPALEGVEQRLQQGGAIADVGCGYGWSSMIMAQAYPATQVVGFDPHGPSIDAARDAAGTTDLDGRLSFEVATATDYPGTGYDLITLFDCLHDMGDPAAALRHARESLAPDGSVMLVEPFAHDDTADNINPVGRMFYGVSTLVCVPASRSQPVGAALGAQAGQRALGEIARAAGFTDVRRATETPFNLVLQLRP